MIFFASYHFFLVLDTTTFISNKVARLQKWKPNTTKLHFLPEKLTFRVKIQIQNVKLILVKDVNNLGQNAIFNMDKECEIDVAKNVKF